MSSGPDDQPAAPVDPDYLRFDCTHADPIAWSRAEDAARAAIEQGECIVLPTDTVYGIAADAFSPASVQRLLDAKQRGRDMPPPVLIAEPALLRALATDVPDAAKELIERHWPGPLTVICRRQPSLKMDLGETEGTVALRVPDHELARDILRSTGPLAVSSANLSGSPAALDCDEAIRQLGDRVAVYLDGGALDSGGGAPSTIVDFTQTDAGQVLRHGALSLEELRETCPDLEDLVPAESTDPEPAEATRPEPAEATRPESVEGQGLRQAQPAVDEHAQPAVDKHAQPAEAQQAPAVGDYTTDELGITHPDVDPYQPDLFGGDSAAAESAHRTGRDGDE